MEEKKTVQPADKPNAPKKTQKPKPKKSSNEEFKRRYFDYYDDIKISDRQDW